MFPLSWFPAVQWSRVQARRSCEKAVEKREGTARRRQREKQSIYALELSVAKGALLEACQTSKSLQNSAPAPLPTRWSSSHGFCHRLLESRLLCESVDAENNTVYNFSDRGCLTNIALTRKKKSKIFRCNSYRAWQCHGTRKAPDRHFRTFSPCPKMRKGIKTITESISLFFKSFFSWNWEKRAVRRLSTIRNGNIFSKKGDPVNSMSLFLS